MKSLKSVLLLVFCGSLFLFHTGVKGQSSPTSQPPQSPKNVDSLFRVATNSPGFLVIKKTDWDQIKLAWTDSLKQKNEKLASLEGIYQRRLDSLSKANQPTPQTADSEEEKPITIDSSQVQLFYQVGLAVLLIYSIFVTIRMVGINKGRKSQDDRLAQLEEDLGQHKKTSIERERKLMRELIDTRNQVQELTSGEKSEPTEESTD